ncbi:MAG: hypothetical protein WC831_03535 [Parcubacteria group bacterium]|jgi:hypothetical protein
MLSENLKNIIKKTGGKFIIIENERPEFVVMGWDEYEKSCLSSKAIQLLTEEELIDKINSDIAMWRENKEDAKEDLISEIEKLEDIEYI